MRGMKSFALAGSSLAAAAAAALALSPAVGQAPGSALKGHDTDAPVDVYADRIEVQTNGDRALLSGNVVVRQGNLELNAPRVTVVYADTGDLQIRRIDATGGVVLRSPSETARSQYAIYDTGPRLITLVGGVTLRRADAQVTGGRLVLELDTGRVVMDGAPGSPAASDAQAPSGIGTAPNGRVTGRFTMPRRDD